MINLNDDDQEKVNEYLDIIKQRILAPIKREGIQSSCTATLLLIFAGVDGMGKLLHPKDDAAVTDRIKKFLDFMGGEYADHKRELLRLRHSLVHNAINVESYLSQTVTGGDAHLSKIGAAGFIYVNTLVMSKDFEDAFERFKSEIQNDSAMMERAANRLEWIDDDPLDEPEIPGVASPSHPSPVRFIHTKK